MMNHINPFKYQDRIEAVRQEIEVRKANGEVPERLVPKTNLRFRDWVDFFIVIFSLEQMLVAFSTIIFGIVIFVMGLNSETTAYFFSWSLILVNSVLLYGGIELIRRKIRGVGIVFLSLILNPLVLFFLGKDALSNVLEMDTSGIQLLGMIPFSGILFLGIILVFVIRSGPRKASDVFKDYVTFGHGKIHF